MSVSKATRHEPEIEPPADEQRAYLMATRVNSLIKTAEIEVSGLPVELTAGLARRHSIIVAGCLAICFSVSGEDALWINGRGPPQAAWSHAVEPRRSLMDDFVVPAGEKWIVRRFELNGVWNIEPPGTGEAMQLSLYENIEVEGEGVPGALLFTFKTTNLTEETTGEFLFERPVVRACVDVKPIAIPAGHYWLDMQMQGSDYFLQGMINWNVLSPVWLRYDDFPPVPRRGDSFFGVNYDSCFSLYGSRPGACDSDIDEDGQVAFSDLLAVLRAWGPCERCVEDLDGDQHVGFADLLIVLATWGPCI